MTLVICYYFESSVLSALCCREDLPADRNGQTEAQNPSNNPSFDGTFTVSNVTDSRLPAIVLLSAVSDYVDSPSANQNTQEVKNECILISTRQKMCYDSPSACKS